MTRAIHKVYLKVSAVVVGGFGPIFALGTMPATHEPARLSLDILAWPIDGFPSYGSSEIHFLSALTGGFLLGWGMLIWFLSGKAYDKASDEVRKAVVGGLVAWFILDSAGSIASGNPSNVLFNVAVILLAVGPLWRPAREDRKARL